MYVIVQSLDKEGRSFRYAVMKETIGNPTETISTPSPSSIETLCAYWQGVRLERSDDHHYDVETVGRCATTTF